MSRPLTIRGGTLSAHFRHQDPLETCLAYRQERGLDPEVCVERDMGERLASRLGEDHETTVVHELVRKHAGDVVTIGARPDDAGKHLQEADTLAAMDAGARIVVGGFLRMGTRLAQLAEALREQWRLPEAPLFWGEPDVLRRIDSPRCGGRFRDWFYAPGDVKCARRSKLPAQLQVAFYAWLLQDVQGILPPTGWVLPRPLDPDDDSVTRWDAFPIADALPIVELFLREEYWKIVTAEPETLVSSSKLDGPLAGEWARERGLAADTLADSDLAFLPGMRRPARRRLILGGVRRIRELAALDDAALATYVGPGVTAEGLRRPRRQAEACVSGRVLWRDDDLGDLEAALGLRGWHRGEPPEEPVRLDDPDATVVYLDLEGDPFIGAEYLLGWSVRRAGRAEPDRPVFAWAEAATAAAERAAFEGFLDAMDAMRARGQRSITVVHYGNYEPTHLRQLAERHPTSTSGVDNVARVETLCERMIDCLRLVQRSLILPFKSYSLKDVAPGLETLPPPGGPGTGQRWHVLPDLDCLAGALRARGIAARDVAAACAHVGAVARAVEIDVTTLLEPSAMTSAFWWQRFCEDRAPVWRMLVELYNGDDLEATWKLHAWLVALQRRGGRP